MVTLTLPPAIDEAEPDSVEEADTMAREGLPMLLEPVAGRKAYDQETTHWCYRVPFPGVRYYFYHEG